MADEHWQGALENGGVDEDELIPLPTAATIAYYQVTESEKHHGSQVEAAEIMQAAAIALSTVAPVYWGTTRLTTREVEDALYRPLKDKADRQSLEEFGIRRRDLKAAILTLKQARTTFRRK
jgi:hypothetical protein